MTKFSQTLLVYVLNIISALALIGFVAALLLFPLMYLFRDGLGPDAPPPSEGFEAIRRTLSHPYYTLLLFGSPALLFTTRSILKRCDSVLQAQRIYSFTLILCLVVLAGNVFFYLI